MINNEENNIVLSKEQMDQIAYYQSRIFNLQTEADISQKTVSSLRNDTLRLEQEKREKEELLASLNIKISEAQSVLESTVSAGEEAQKNLKETTEKIQNENASIDGKMAEIEQRVAVVEQRETEVQARESDYIQKKNSFEKEVEVFNAKVYEIKKVIEKF